SLQSTIAFISSLEMDDMEEAHKDKDLQKSFPDWHVVTLSWARHDLGYNKAHQSSDPSAEDSRIDD
ncbi:hypothetical protein PENTCL1PPCAC_16557, partial [Pristionchus entomophagus]